ncbi:hypothetical protein [Chryseobacterium gilvum]|nr:hypothetical protein [Chryseobacterium gilvum]
MHSFNLKVFLSLLFIFTTHLLFSQITRPNVVMEFEKSNDAQKSRLLNLVMVVKNLESERFKGKVQLICPKGFRNVNAEDASIELAPQETRYIPIKIIIGEDAQAGSSVIIAKLFTQSGILISEQSTSHTIDIDQSLIINPIATSIYRSSDQEPLSIKIKVSNTGNVKQDITVVCKFPDPEDSNLFMEQEAAIEAKKDSIFTFTYIPTKSLARLSNFIINISGFRNPDKEIFGSASIAVQNISSVQKYHNLEFSNFSEETKNQITASYRKVGKDINMYQITGSGGVNVSSGYIFMRGNIAFLDHQQNLLVTNTNLVYRQGNNEYSIGSVNKLLDMTIVGRGAEYSHVFSKYQKLEIGFVDQNFNVAEKNSWLKNGYGFFAKGTLHSNNSSRNMAATYIYRYDPFEKVKHSILGTEINHSFNQLWFLNAKVNGGISSYESENRTKPSFSAESNYSGKIKNFNLNGNYFFSTDYYPGNRRGSMQIQQNISKDIKEHTLHSNISISNFSPKFYFFERAQQSQNTRIEVGNRFPKIKDFNISILYQYQNESSNSYNNFFGNQLNTDVQHMTAHRIVEQISWIHPASRQSAVLSLETGTVQYPTAEENRLQMKVNANYSFRKFNFNTIYQSGSYYLSEYAFSTLTDANAVYKKFSVSLFYNDNVMKDKINLSTGVSYINDQVYGKSPSAFFNAKYSGKKFDAFINSSWYHYSSGLIRNNLMTFEVGMTLNLRKTILNKEKKSVIKAFAFYDDNTNNIFDEGEKPASDYILTIENVALKTDSEGEASYKSVPFGKYTLKPFIQQGWYYDEMHFEVDRYAYALDIPLHQNGSLQGKVLFNYNTKTALDFEHRGSAIGFSIFKENQLLQKIYTNDEGEFTAFLPTGKYTILLDEPSLPANTFCDMRSYEVQITAGKISKIPDFVIKVKEKKINTIKFGN